MLIEADCDYRWLGRRMEGREEQFRRWGIFLTQLRFLVGQINCVVLHGHDCAAVPAGRLLLSVAADRTADRSAAASASSQTVHVQIGTLDRKGTRTIATKRKKNAQDVTPPQPKKNVDAFVLLPCAEMSPIFHSRT